MRTERAEVAVMLRPARQRIHRCAANVGAIEIDQCTLGFAAFANVSRSTRLGSMDGFFTCLDTGLQIFLVRSGSLHMVLLGKLKRMVLRRSQG
jgi:tartrate dehydratase alpha subunit/fumarate hydratase class I-like protein